MNESISVQQIVAVANVKGWPFDAKWADFVFERPVPPIDLAVVRRWAEIYCVLKGQSDERRALIAAMSPCDAIAAINKAGKPGRYVDSLVADAVAEWNRDKQCWVIEGASSDKYTLDELEVWRTVVSSQLKYEQPIVRVHAIGRDGRSIVSLDWSYCFQCDSGNNLSVQEIVLQLAQHLATFVRQRRMTAFQPI